ncbi:MAG: hypothetical protein MR992_04710 [Lachnospiraceae bacterium]|nr:hypothetical protein [Lachnospiraceae bacterium]MCI7041423.1 hypothetical protein [Lachnospiraceae bacterium]MCI7191075.1 hypothetical protein [Lachnospiraceae bacterium]MDD7626645.1 hypothetical protein [Lachnospiraceae bacterium]MDY4117859.1 hypothetical protein [Lachnospiraceae bacterium]
MSEEKTAQLQDNDFKYVMMDTGNIYLGARFTFGELLEQEMVPFKLKTIIRRYFLPETTEDTSLESQFYYLEKGTILYDTFKQLRIKVKVNVQAEKKSFFGKTTCKYEEKIMSLDELTDCNLARKKASGMIIREIIISKLGLMTFSV